MSRNLHIQKIIAHLLNIGQCRSYLQPAEDWVSRELPCGGLIGMGDDVIEGGKGDGGQKCLVAIRKTMINLSREKIFLTLNLNSQ